MDPRFQLARVSRLIPLLHGGLFRERFRRRTRARVLREGRSDEVANLYAVLRRIQGWRIALTALNASANSSQIRTSTGRRHDGVTHATSKKIS